MNEPLKVGDMVVAIGAARHKEHIGRIGEVVEVGAGFEDFCGTWYPHAVLVSFPGFRSFRPNGAWIVCRHHLMKITPPPSMTETEHDERMEA